MLRKKLRNTSILNEFSFQIFKSIFIFLHSILHSIKLQKVYMQQTLLLLLCRIRTPTLSLTVCVFVDVMSQKLSNVFMYVLYILYYICTEYIQLFELNICHWERKRPSTQFNIMTFKVTAKQRCIPPYVYGVWWRQNALDIHYYSDKW